MNIAYACNDGYVEQTGISIISLFENNTNASEINIYLISKGISTNNIYIINKICDKYKRNLIVVDFDSIAYDLNISNIGRHIETIYAKIFFSRIDNVDKIFYLDSDTIINGSLEDLWSTNLDGYYMGMVETYTGNDAKKKLGLQPHSKFYNDGVALVNVDYCRKHRLIEKCLNGIEEFNGNPPVLSEGLLNKVCYGKIKSLSPRYNMMAGLYQNLNLSIKYINTILDYTETDLLESYQKPVVIHFLSGFYNRPWLKSCTHPLKNKYIHYKKISPWANTPLRNGQLPLKLRLLGHLLNIIGPRNFSRISRILK